MFIIHTTDEQHTMKLGEIIGKSLSGGEVLALTGDLGSGKTTFVKGLATGLDITEVITSPTFVVIKSYLGRFTLHHMDFYRLGDPGDIENIGFHDFEGSTAILAIEWAEKFLSEIQMDYLHIRFQYEGEDKREIRIESQSLPNWESYLKMQLLKKPEFYLYESNT